jgi:predicted acyltransferase
MASKEQIHFPWKAPQNGPVPSVGGRVVALDALRGFDMFWIIGGRELAVAAAGLYSQPPPRWLDYQLEHAAWEGFTAWDLIMPLFLFVVGAAMPFSFSRRLEQRQSKADLYKKIVRRSVILFILGMIVQGHLLDFNLSTLHIFANTLQAIAVGYLAAAVLLVNSRVAAQALVAALLLVGYWLLLAYVPAAGHRAGELEPNANLALVVDEYVLGRFRDGTPYTWILTGMTFTATVLCGVLAGHLLRARITPLGKVLSLTAMGLASLAGGWAWAEWLDFPIIKHIWTSSMVLWAAGWSYLLLAMFYCMIDMAGVRRWAFPFVVIGLNAITIYVASWFIPFRAMGDSLVSGVVSHAGRAGPVLSAFTAVLLAWLLVYHLYRQRIFLRI